MHPSDEFGPAGIDIAQAVTGSEANASAAPRGPRRRRPSRRGRRLGLEQRRRSRRTMWSSIAPAEHRHHRQERPRPILRALGFAIAELDARPAVGTVFQDLAVRRSSAVPGTGTCERVRSSSRTAGSRGSPRRSRRLPWMQWLTVPAPRRPVGRALDHGRPAFHFGRRIGRGQLVPDDRRERGVSKAPDARIAVPSISTGAARCSLGPGGTEVAHPERDLARDVRDLTGSTKPCRAGSSIPIAAMHAPVYAHRRRTRALDDVVLEQAVDDDHVRAEQLLAAGDPLADRSCRGGRRP